MATWIASRARSIGSASAPAARLALSGSSITNFTRADASMYTTAAGYGFLRMSVSAFVSTYGSASSWRGSGSRTSEDGETRPAAIRRSSSALLEAGPRSATGLS